jgi:SulP family sulfate permease
MPLPEIVPRLRQYGQRFLRDDVAAGLIVAVLLIPQSLAYALLAGVPPQVGIYASLLPMVAYAAFASSSANSVGPAAVLALMTAQVMAPVTGPEGVSPGAAALVLACEVGAMLALAALLKLDALASLLSAPVLSGFSAGAALSIALSQLPALLGTPAYGANAPALLRSWWQSAQDGHGLHAVTTAFGVAGLVLLVASRGLMERVAARWLRPDQVKLVGRCAPLLVMAIAIASAWAFGADARGVALVGPLPSLSPGLALPDADADLWWQLMPGAALIALVVFVSSFAVAEALALQRREQVDGRRELLGLAAANLAAGVGGGMPVGSSFSRSAVNAQAGARTRVAGLWAALAMLLAVLLLATPLALLPRAVLAASIVLPVLAQVDWKAFGAAWRYSRDEAAIMVAVAALTVLLNTQWALGFGVAVSIALLLKHTARPHAALLGRMPGTEHYRNVERYRTEPTPGVLSLRIDESLLFTNARRLPGMVAAHLAEHPDTTRVLLQMSPVNRIDLSGFETLRSLQQVLAERGIRLDLSEVKGPVLDSLRAGGWSEWFQGQVFLSHHQGVNGEQGRPA